MVNHLRNANQYHAAAMTIEGEVLRQIRQHARSNSKTEVCGVLIAKSLETD